MARNSKTQLPSLAGEAWLNEPRLQKLLAVLSEQGEARVAGGAVRNAILKVPVADVDIATTLPPEDVVRVCKDAGFSVHPTGIAHGTVTVVVRHQAFEVTTLRRDVVTDGRRAVVAFTKDWREDALRRDFTMNALYCDAHGKVTDFTNGYADIQKRRVKFVGVPSRRIREDFLRILRFFRFHALYGKGNPDVAGLAACRRQRGNLKSLSAERLRQELFKLLVAPRTVAVLKVMASSGILEVVLPHTKAWHVLGRLPPDPVFKLFVLAREPLQMQARFRLSNDEAKRLKALSEIPRVSPDFRAAERRHVLYLLKPKLWRDAVVLSWAESRDGLDDPAWQSLLNLADEWPVPRFPVSGTDLVASGLAPGPALGEMLRRLEDYWIASDFKPAREALLRHAKTMETPDA